MTPVLKKVGKLTGIYTHASTLRRFRGAPDACYYITWKNERRRKFWEKVGWASEGITAKYAQQLRAERMRTLRLGEEPIPAARRKRLEMTFGEFARDVYLPASQVDKKPRTCVQEEVLLRLWIEPEIGGKALGDVSPIDVERIKRRLHDAGRSPRTIQYALVVTKAVMNAARRHRHFSGDNPVDGVAMPRFDNARTRFLTREEAEELLGACLRASPRLHEICLVSLHCGLREGEVVDLKWQDVDFASGQLVVRDAKNSVSRHAPMSGDVRAMLERKAAARGRRGAPGDHVIPGKDGGPSSGVTKIFDKVVGQLGYNEGVTDRRHRVVFHTLRHTYASWLAMDGNSLIVIKEMLGHKTTRMTERYSHLIPDVKRQAVRIFDGVTGESAAAARREKGEGTGGGSPGGNAADRDS